MSNENANERRTMEVVDIDVIREAHLPGFILDAITSQNFYRIKEPGVLELNAGVRSKGTPLYVDVSGLTPEIKSLISSHITRMNVDQIVSEFHPHGQSVDLLPLDGMYNDLSRSDKSALGTNYVELQSTEGGLKIRDAISNKGFRGELYLNVPLHTTQELRDKIAPEIIHLIEKEPGLYEQFGEGIEEAKDKQM